MLFRSELIEFQPIADHVLDAVIIEIRCIAAAVGAGQHVIISTQPRRDVGLDEPRIAERDAELVVDQLGLDRRRDAITELMRSDEHKSELQSLMRISSAVYCLKKKTK